MSGFSGNLLDYETILESDLIMNDYTVLSLVSQTSSRSQNPRVLH